MSISSVRVGNIHYSPTGKNVFKSVNLAKKESRRIGGYTNVRAFAKWPGDSEMERLLGAKVQR